MDRLLRSDRAVDAVLLFAITVDVVLPALAVVDPDLWFRTLHPGLSPSALDVAFLWRAAAQWVAFTAVQAPAYVLWRRRPLWLVLVAGARTSDVFTDLTYRLTAPGLGAYAWTLFVPPVLNAGMAWFLWRAYRQREVGQAQGASVPVSE